MLLDLFQPFHLLLVLPIAVIVLVVPFWQIFRKAGFPPGLAFLMLVPGANLLAIWFLAFAHWKPAQER